MTEAMGPDNELDPAELASNFMGKELLEAMVAELDATRTPWHNMTESDQHLAIERLRTKTRNLVVGAMRILFTGEYPACPATLTTLRVGGAGSRGVIEIPKNALNRHELMDRVGQSVVVLMIDPEQHLQQMEAVKARGQQGDLFKGREVPHIPDDGLDLDDTSDETQALEDAGGVMDPEEQAAEEAKWIETANNRMIERHVETGQERKSTRALALELLEKVTTANMNPSLDSIDFDEQEVLRQPRQQVLFGLLWIDSYAQGKVEDTLARPDFLRIKA